MKVLRRIKRAYIHYISRRIRKYKLENRILRSAPNNVTEAARLVNTLIDIERIENKRYLEVGVEYGYTFANVLCDKKYAVDPNLRFNKFLKPKSWNLYEMTSDDFFEALDKSVKFDFIFLDGLHTSEQTYKDFRNCLPHLKKNSVIIIDDTVPCDEFSANPDQALSYRLRLESGNPGDGSWHGDVFKVVIALNSLKNFQFNLATISDLNNPKTVIWIDSNADWPKNLPSMPEVRSNYSDFFAAGVIHQSFNPMSEKDFYESFKAGRK